MASGRQADFVTVGRSAATISIETDKLQAIRVRRVKKRVHRTLHFRIRRGGKNNRLVPG
jgi:hypothetical protein